VCSFRVSWQGPTTCNVARRSFAGREPEKRANRGIWDYLSRHEDADAGIASQIPSTQFTVPNNHLLRRFKVIRQLLNHVHRTMLPTRAADANGEVTTIVLFE